MKPLLSTILLIANLAAGLTGPDTGFWQLVEVELAGPVEVVLTNGASIRGHAAASPGTGLRLGVADGSGEIIHTIEQDQIESVRPPGDSYRILALEWMEAGETDAARRLMENLFTQRVQLLPYLGEEDSNFFIHYLRLVQESEDAARTVALAERLRPQVRHPAALQALDTAILESYHRMGICHEAEILANEWVATRPPYGPSALGYFILAAAELRNDRPSSALEISLRPVVFSSAAPMDYLGNCYAVAATSALRLRDPQHALLLYREMRDRGLTWPDDPDLADVRTELEALFQQKDRTDQTSQERP